MSKRKYDAPTAGHEYDGIRKPNKRRPKWWLVTFYGIIILAVIYFGYYELGRDPSNDETLKAATTKTESRYEEGEQKAEEAAPVAKIDVAAVMADEAAMAVGKGHYDTKCMPCHGRNGEGTIGPNLTDNHWIHGKGDVEDIMESFLVGFPEKGMPPWDKQIPEKEYVPLAVYVMTLQGTNPPNPKDPQGELVGGESPE
jgi:cytochrome c oxidase cbb3-type subunit 3